MPFVYSHPTRQRRHLVVGLTLAAAVLSGCQTSQTRAAAPTGPPQVATVVVTPEPLVLTTELPGRTSAYLVAEIRPQVSGIVQSRLFREGANVRAGDVLYQIDPAPYQSALAQAKAALATAEAELVTAEANLPALRLREERLRGLVAIHAAAQQDLDDTRAAVRQAEAALAARKAAIEVSRAAVESARINLSYTPVKAPIAGRIGISNITVGALATAHQPTPLAVVQQLDPIYVDVAQANADLLRLRQRLQSGELKRNGSVQNKVKLILEDKTNYPLEGTLQFRDVTVEPTTGSTTLRLLFRNPKQTLLPGMFVRAVVQEGLNPHALLAPQQGVTRNARGQAIAWVVGAGEKVEERILELDRAIGDRWLVTSGLAAGDRVIVEGRQKVRPGATVRAIHHTPTSSRQAGAPGGGNV